MAAQSENSESAKINIPAKDRRGAEWFRTYSPQYWFLTVMLVGAMLMSLITLVVFLTSNQPTNAATTKLIPEAQITSTNNPEYQKVYPDSQEQPAVYPIDPGFNMTLPSQLKIITRREWLSQPPMGVVQPLILPVPYVFVMETSTEDCTDQAACTFHVRFLQSYHIDSKGWEDISYNFLVGGDGFAYEGRGWKSQGAHTYGYNSKSIGIAFVGSFNHTMPPLRQIIAAKQLINIGLEKGFIAADFKLLATRQVESTETPGLALYEDLQKWPHWSEKP